MARSGKSYPARSWLVAANTTVVNRAVLFLLENLVPVRGVREWQPVGAQVFHAQRVVPPLSSGIKSPIQRLTCACPIANFTPQARALA